LSDEPQSSHPDLVHPGFFGALSLAAELHGAQQRKTTLGHPPGPSYLGHVLGVAATVIDAGGTRVQVIAALLHDAVEDTDTTVDDIRMRFGDEVASIVAACTDSETSPKPPWRERKERYVEHLATADPAALLVTAADKLNNARTMLRDHAAVGDELWDRFNPEAHYAWYYPAVAEVVRERLDNPIVAELDEVVERLVGILPSPEQEPPSPSARRRSRAKRKITPPQA